MIFRVSWGTLAGKVLSKVSALCLCDYIHTIAFRVDYCSQENLEQRTNFVKVETIRKRLGKPDVNVYKLQRLS